MTPIGGAEVAADDLIEFPAVAPFLDELPQLARGSQIIFGLHRRSIQQDGKSMTVWLIEVVALEQAEDLTFLWNCNGTLGTCTNADWSGVRAFLSEKFPDRPLTETLDLLYDGSPLLDELIAVSAPGEPQASWEDQDPWNRVVDPDETPPEILDALEPFAIGLEVDESLAGALSKAGWGICTRSSMGWNPCVPTELVLEGTGPIPLDGFAVPGEPVEVWLVPNPDQLAPGEIADIAAGQATFLDNAVGPVGTFRVGPETIARIEGTPPESIDVDTLRTALANKNIRLVVER